LSNGKLSEPIGFQWVVRLFLHDSQSIARRQI
jgi:hypothetical protein